MLTIDCNITPIFPRSILHESPKLFRQDALPKMNYEIHESLSKIKPTVTGKVIKGGRCDATLLSKLHNWQFALCSFPPRAISL